jgi:hypothetical protein
MGHRAKVNEPPSRPAHTGTHLVRQPQTARRRADETRPAGFAELERAEARDPVVVVVLVLDVGLARAAAVILVARGAAAAAAAVGGPRRC